ncbi:DUF1932 domain-containing protein [Streptomyces sp. NPDC007856]|uniref:DUF1932 domain-containing protein n=1 Tax=Streptomyces sp. NPDC007856 TaxID=3364781 RepID=UPI003698D84B
MANISAILLRSGATVVDGSVIGSPPSNSKRPRFYLSGPAEALPAVLGLFDGSSVQARALSGGVGQAPALKLSYSSYQKASRALAAVAYALASDHGVEGELLDIAAGRTTSYLTETTYFPKVAARSWRWGPEMREAAHALEEAGLPSDLANAAAAVMERWSGLKDASPDLALVMEELHTGPHGDSS